MSDEQNLIKEVDEEVRQDNYKRYGINIKNTFLYQ